MANSPENGPNAHIVKIQVVQQCVPLFINSFVLTARSLDIINNRHLAHESRIWTFLPPAVLTTYRTTTKKDELLVCNVQKW